MSRSLFIRASETLIQQLQGAHRGDDLVHLVARQLSTFAGPLQPGVQARDLQLVSITLAVTLGVFIQSFLYLCL